MQHKIQIARESVPNAKTLIVENITKEAEEFRKKRKKSVTNRRSPLARNRLAGLRQRVPPPGANRVRCGPTHAHKTGRSMRELFLRQSDHGNGGVWACLLYTSDAADE